MNFTLADIYDSADISKLRARLTADKRAVFFSPVVDDNADKSQQIHNKIQDILTLCKNSVGQQQQGFQLHGLFKKPIEFPLSGRLKGKLLQNKIQKLSITFTLLKEIQRNIEKCTVFTSRDIFYRNVELFKSQRLVVDTVDHIQKALGLTIREDLNITATQKGLIFTAVDIIINSSDTKKIKITKGKSQLIPQFDNNAFIMVCKDDPQRILKVLVIEKDAVYNTIIQKPPEGYIVVTGKGYPDMLTRKFLHRLEQCNSNLQFVILTDPDPHGINIAMKYQGFTADSIYPCASLIRKGISILELIGGHSSTIAQVLPLSTRDIKLAQNILFSGHSDLYANMRTELQRQLFLTKKGEMNTTIIEHLLSNDRITNY